MATRGRKPTAAPAAEPEILDVAGEQQAAQALTTMRQQALTEETEIRAEAYRLGQLVGARQMARATANFVAAADVSLFEEISKSKGYKHIPIQRPDGTVAAATNIDEFCALIFGRSRSAMTEGKLSLQALGAECYEIASNLGLPRTQMRLLLSLPEDERQAVQEAMREGGDKSEVVTLIQSLANKLDETRAQVEDLKADLEATREVSAEKGAEIERLKEERVRIKKLPADEVWEELAKETNDHLKEVREKLDTSVRSAFTALAAHAETYGGSNARHFMGGHLGEVQQILNQLRESFHLRDVEGDGTREWMNWTGHDADGAAAASETR